MIERHSNLTHLENELDKIVVADNFEKRIRLCLEILRVVCGEN